MVSSCRVVIFLARRPSESDRATAKPIPVEEKRMSDYTEYYLYAGLGGDTDPGRFWRAGLYRSDNGNGAWESLGARIEPAPRVYAILTDGGRPGRITIGTDAGVWRSDD